MKRLALFAAPASVSAGVSCLNEFGSPVPWFAGLTDGTGTSNYYYMDSSSDQFGRSKYSLDQSSSGSLMQTVNQIYRSSDLAFAMYNDEPPPDKTESSTYAHAKGILMSDSSSAVWIVHSKPHWPASDAPSAFPDFTYAQNFMCVTLTPDQFEQVSKLLQISYPYFYTSNVPDSLDLPEFSALISKTKTDSSSDSYSFGSFTAFAKSKTWGKDMWEGEPK